MGEQLPSMTPEEEALERHLAHKWLLGPTSPDWARPWQLDDIVTKACLDIVTRRGGFIPAKRGESN